jgi:hypothetical protein
MYLTEKLHLLFAGIRQASRSIVDRMKHSEYVKTTEKTVKNFATGLTLIGAGLEAVAVLSKQKAVKERFTFFGALFGAMGLGHHMGSKQIATYYANQYVKDGQIEDDRKKLQNS